MQHIDGNSGSMAAQRCVPSMPEAKKTHWNNHLDQFSTRRRKLTRFSKQQSHLQQKCWVFHLFFFSRPFVNLYMRSLEHGLSAQCGDLVICDQRSTVYAWCILRYVFMLYDNQIGITIIINYPMTMYPIWLFFFLNVLHPGWGNGCILKTPVSNGARMDVSCGIPSSEQSKVKRVKAIFQA